MAEVFIIGTILGASGFPRSSLCAKWGFTTGETWTLVEGDEAGQTQVDLPEVRKSHTLLQEQLIKM
jgi:B9 domain-containing protein 2